MTDAGGQLPEKVMAILACPLGKSELRQEEGALVCMRCGPRFKFSRYGYPILLIEEADLPPGCSSIAELPCQRQAEK